ncbi:alpha-ketoglutarate-dependent dioxygenase alkB homolog 6-like [Halichondria panicea]|uniref:alpha-ketoglutarate-dependent dioxygenase alkB homolog 6-like n=1 Tax=Halichondria panicea TaxID=6063 RepID=UPI00312B68E6
MEELDLKRYLVSEAPPTVYYIPNFVSQVEGKLLWDKVYSAPCSKWTQLSRRRLQNWGGTPHPKGMMVEPLPQWLEDRGRRIASLGVFEDKVPNHVLVNEYTPGQGIMPHQDGPLYYPTVSTISLGSHTLLDFYRPVPDSTKDGDASLESRYFLSVLLEPNSLLILKDAMYQTFLHGIAETKEDVVSDKICNLSHLSKPVNIGDHLNRSTRVSLTIRFVPKTLKLKLKF